DLSATETDRGSAELRFLRIPPSRIVSAAPLDGTARQYEERRRVPPCGRSILPSLRSSDNASEGLAPSENSEQNLTAGLANFDTQSPRANHTTVVPRPASWNAECAWSR